jgi:hypothetical protein
MAATPGSRAGASSRNKAGSRNEKGDEGKGAPAKPKEPEIDPAAMYVS